MTMSINTNIGAMTALQTLSKTSNELEVTQKRVATGLRVSEAKDDAASFAISGRMDGDIKALQSVKTGIGMGEAVLGTTVGAGEQVAELLKEMKAKAVQATSGGLSTSDRNAISADITSLQDQIGTIVATAEFNGINLINNTTATLSVAGDKDGGNDIVVAAATLDSTATINVSSVTTASGTVGRLNTELNDVLSDLATFGSAQQRIESQGKLTDTLIDSLTAGVGSLIDADMARESSKLQSLQIQQQLGVQSLGIANSNPQMILGLFG